MNNYLNKRKHNTVYNSLLVLAYLRKLFTRVRFARVSRILLRLLAFLGSIRFVFANLVAETRNEIIHKTIMSN